MRRIILGLAVLCLLGGAYLLTLARDRAPSEQDLVEALRAGDPSLASAEVSITQCRFQLRNAARLGQTEAISRTELDLDLRLFDLQSVQVRTLDNGRVVLVISRRDVTDAVVAQAEAIVSALPAAVADKMTQASSLSDLRGVLETEGAQIQFNVQPQVTKNAEGNAIASLQPSPQAPLFYDFIEAVRALPAPRTYAALLTYADGTQTRETFVAGSLGFPAQMQLSAGSGDEARALGEILFRYYISHCDAQTG